LSRKFSTYSAKEEDKQKHEILGSVPPSTLHEKRKISKGKAPLVVSDIRRSTTENTRDLNVMLNTWKRSVCGGYT
jgi:hypothetical protein